MLSARGPVVRRPLSFATLSWCRERTLCPHASRRLHLDRLCGMCARVQFPHSAADNAAKRALCVSTNAAACVCKECGRLQEWCHAAAAMASGLRRQPTGVYCAKCRHQVRFGSFTSPRCTHAGVWCRLVRRGANHAPFRDCRESAKALDRVANAAQRACASKPQRRVVCERANAVGMDSFSAWPQASAQLTGVHSLSSMIVCTLGSEGETVFPFKSSCGC